MIPTFSRIMEIIGSKIMLFQIREIWLSGKISLMKFFVAEFLVMEQFILPLLFTNKFHKI